MIWNRLGVLTDEVSENLVEALDWVADRALKHVEIRMVDGVNVVNLTDEQVDRVLYEVEKRGLFVSAITSPVFKCALNLSCPVSAGDTFGLEEEDVESHFLRLRRSIQIAKKLKTMRIRVFSFWRELDPRRYEEEIVDHLKKAAAIAVKENMLLLLENEPSCNGGYASEVARFVHQADSPAMKVLWDPGNEEYGGRPAFPDGYEMVKDLIGHVHLKDAWINEERLPYCVPIGTGQVPFAKQLEALERNGYTGLYTIETHYIPEGGTAKDGTELTLQGLRKVLKGAKLI
jgi:sugar phosphate isomerase/epimerase